MPAGIFLLEEGSPIRTAPTSSIQHASQTLITALWSRRPSNANARNPTPLCSQDLLRSVGYHLTSDQRAPQTPPISPGMQQLTMIVSVSSRALRGLAKEEEEEEARGEEEGSSGI